MFCVEINLSFQRMRNWSYRGGVYQITIWYMTVYC